MPETTMIVDCACCGIHVVTEPGGKCDSCDQGECDPAVTWHCSEIDWCDGTVCDTHTPARRPVARRRPRYVKWEAPDGAVGALRLDEDSARAGWWVSRRFPGMPVVEWIGYVSRPDAHGEVWVRSFASQYGEGLARRAIRYGDERRAERVVACAVRRLALGVVAYRLRYDVYGPQATVARPNAGRRCHNHHA